MHRATWVYIGMAIAAIAGMWVILTIGGRLVPPRDFAGTWALTPQPGSASLGNAVRIEQSGRFFQLQFSGGTLLQMTVTDAPGASTELSLVGRNASATLKPQGDSEDAAILSVRGATTGTWLAHWQTHTFAGDTAPAATPGTHAHAGD